ncbi:MAG: ABC transporter ATP-binding protein [Rhodospirillaceae bacterium]|nr:ABC transporter ATP-binding protein [Rhodospirillaceae bacterium]
MAGPAIKLETVTKAFADNHVLRGIDLDVPAGGSVVVIGPSGTGKTVLLKTLIGVHTPDSGRMSVDGTEVSALDAAGRRGLYGRFGMLFQKSGLFDSLPVWENVAFRLLQQDRMSRREARDRAIEKLGLVGLAPGEADLFPSELSGGMQKRVGIARAMAADPDVLLLDEPTAGLDPIMSNIINDLILEVMETTGATVVSVNSDMKGAARTAQTAAMIYDGRIIWSGPTADMRASGNPYVDQFVNSRAEGPIPTVVDPAA